MGICYDSYTDNKRETLNSLLHVQTPFPERSNPEEISVKIASCACFPFKLLEGVGMITCGALLWILPCTVCKIKTHHQGTEVDVEKIAPSFRKPHIPCHYEDVSKEFIKDSDRVNCKEISGYQLGCHFNQHPTGELPDIYNTSTLTGYQCLTSGIGKIVNTLFNFIWCPFTISYLACCDKKDKVQP